MTFDFCFFILIPIPHPPFHFFNRTSVADSHKITYAFPMKINLRSALNQASTTKHGTSKNTCSRKLDRVSLLVAAVYLKIKPLGEERTEIAKFYPKSSSRVHQLTH